MNRATLAKTISGLTLVLVAAALIGLAHDSSAWAGPPYYYHHHNNYNYGYNPYYRPYYVNPLPAPMVVMPQILPPVVIYDGRPIELVNPPDSTQAISYVLNGAAYSIQPGQVQPLVYDRTYTIRFNRGTPGNDAVYSLKPGRFKFVIGQFGWDLVRTADQGFPQGALAPPNTLAPPPAPLNQLPTN